MLKYTYIYIKDNVWNYLIGAFILKSYSNTYLEGPELNLNLKDCKNWVLRTYSGQFVSVCPSRCPFVSSQGIECRGIKSESFTVSRYYCTRYSVVSMYYFTRYLLYQSTTVQGTTVKVTTVGGTLFYQGTWSNLSVHINRIIFRWSIRA